MWSAGCSCDRECQYLAHKLLKETCRKYNIVPGHSRSMRIGRAMKSKSVEQLLLELQVTRSHSRPRVSNDNPYSEAGFKTMKYSSHFPERFASQEDAQTFCQDYFVWYNTQHHHTGLVLLTPEQVHFGDAPKLLAQRQVTLDAAYAAHPQRSRNVRRRGSCPKWSGSMRRFTCRRSAGTSGGLIRVAFQKWLPAT